MPTDVLLQLVTTFGILPALFIWLLIRVMKQSDIRENRLMAHLDRSNENIEKIAHTLEKMDERIMDIERQIEVKAKG